ncbi:hypothetical protein LTR85_005861 [Meristemomyces frigidus]|nr:hypothetical protein LTR85_005861 [Meristemomyces frigidus]
MSKVVHGQMQTHWLTRGPLSSGTDRFPFFGPLRKKVKLSDVAKVIAEQRKPKPVEQTVHDTPVAPVETSLEPEALKRKAAQMDMDDVDEQTAQRRFGNWVAYMDQKFLTPYCKDGTVPEWKAE